MTIIQALVVAALPVRSLPLLSSVTALSVGLVEVWSLSRDLVTTASRRFGLILSPAVGWSRSSPREVICNVKYWWPNYLDSICWHRAQWWEHNALQRFVMNQCKSGLEQKWAGNVPVTSAARYFVWSDLQTDWRATWPCHIYRYKLYLFL